MIHTLKVDDSTVKGKRPLKERTIRKNTEFENISVTGIIPKGYVTGDEFVKRVKEGLRKKLTENGYL